MARIALFLFALFCSFPALAIDCHFTDFKDVNVEQKDRYYKLVYLSALNQKDFSDFTATHKGGMIIPYLDVPMSDDNYLNKQNLNTVRNLLQYDLTDAESDFVLGSAITKTGASSYMACLRAQRIVIEIDQSDIFANQFIATVSWFALQNEKGIFKQPPLLVNGKALNDFTKQELEDKGSIAIEIERDPLKRFTLAINLNNSVQAIHLPPKPTKTIKTVRKVFPTVIAHTENDTRWQPDIKHPCYHPDPGSLFVMGDDTATIESEIVGDRSYASVDKKTISPTNVCMDVGAGVTSTDWSAAVKATLSILEASAVEETVAIKDAVQPN